MDIPLNNFSTRIGLSMNVCNATRRATKKKRWGRNIWFKSKKEANSIEEIVHEELFFGNGALMSEKNQQVNIVNVVSGLGSTVYMVNSLNNITNLQ